MKTFLVAFIVLSCSPAVADEAFSVGGRPQRVRFFLASHGLSFDDTQKFMGPGQVSIDTLIQDPVQSKPDVPQGKFIREGLPGGGDGVGLGDFAEGSVYASLVINPGLILCNTDLLKLVVQVGQRNPEFFARKEINEINLFVRTVPDATQDEKLRVGVTPAAKNQPGSALNVLIEYLPKSLNCSLPSLGVLQQKVLNQ